MTDASADAPLLYVILGTTGSGRQRLVADLIDGANLTATQTFIPEGLIPTPEVKLGPASPWQWTDEKLTSGPLEPGREQVFIIADGAANPVDFIEALPAWIATQGLELGRLITVVDCQLTVAFPEMAVWYDACAHFSDVILLANRDGVENKWMTAFQNRYKTQCYPAHFELLKKGQVRNPGLILEPQALRMTHYFDEGDDWVGQDDAIVEDDASWEEGEEVEVPELMVDPYFERQTGGRREKVIPDVAAILAKRG